MGQTACLMLRESLTLRLHFGRVLWRLLEESALRAKGLVIGGVHAVDDGLRARIGAVMAARPSRRHPPSAVETHVLALNQLDRVVLAQGRHHLLHTDLLERSVLGVVPLQRAEGLLALLLLREAIRLHHLQLHLVLQACVLRINGVVGTDASTLLGDKPAHVVLEDAAVLDGNAD